jgi:hypothetical protein
MLKCKYCGEIFPKLAKAHIIPRSFYKVVRGDDKYSIELTIGESYENKKNWQSGIHDSKIICEECEKLFCEFDTHGYKVLSEALSQKKIWHDSNGHTCAYLVEKVDYHKLKLFFLSMLWRAHASTHIFWEHVKLGCHESIIRSCISKKIGLSHDDYEVIMFHPLNQSYSNLIIPPWPQEFYGVNFYRFYLPGVIALIKVDERPLPDILKPIILNESTPHRLFFYNDNDSAGSETRYLEKMKDLMRLKKS